ncbi:MAG: acyltransferase domain-containing protein, partial [Spirochaetales bacterium]|nr:acyltransferase domain-containing protein [Spirochaetales bacterium]
ESYRLYQVKGIGEEIYINTMKYCTRTLNEYHRVYGRYGYDSAWWFPRQISLYLFRLGSLEYEMYIKDGEKLLSIHIPSDADMNASALRKSWLQARSFFREFYPDYGSVPMFCSSWLLYPELQDILPGSSKIIGFLREFSIRSVDKESRECMKWIFGREDIPLDQLPEKSSLQRSVKALMLKGENIGEAYGILKDDPWTE